MATLALASIVAMSSSALPQGRERYMNIEAPQAKPLAEGVFVSRPTQGGPASERRLLFACNTPNDTIEVFDLGVPGAAQSTRPVLLAELTVGASPVSVLPIRFVPGGINGTDAVNAVFSANFLGDSISYLTFDFTVSAAGAVNAFATWPVGTIDVGDEPMDLALRDTPGVDADIPFLYVAKRTASSYAVVNARPEAFEVVVQDVALVVPVGAGQQFTQFALKEPHRVLMHPTRDELWVLGHQGGNGEDGTFFSDGLGTIPAFDFDICVVDLTDPTSTQPLMGLVDGLGSTNFNMAFVEGGDRLYVVGTEARVRGTDALEGNAALEAADTGFVRTELYRVDASSFPGASPEIDTWDMNRLSGTGAPVDRVDSLAHLTDVTVLDSVATEDIVYVSAFHSDNFARLEVAIDGIELTEERVHLWEGAAPPRTGLRGPRSLVVHADTEDVIVLNRVQGGLAWLNRDNGAYVFDAADDLLPMAPSREPDYMVDGREFLYSTRFSGNGFVSCSSCHADGRSDQQAWLLTPEDGLIAPFDLDAVLEELDEDPGLTFPPEKGHMVTQSFQGLANFEMNRTRMLAPAEFTPAGDSLDFSLVSNAPFHWRGDKPTFLNFNEAFVGLQGMEFTGAGGNAAYEAFDANEGLSAAEMDAFEEFIMSIHYGPNPLQDADRSYTGNAAAGLQAFHQDPAFFDVARSCVVCHSLPEGSNNRIVSSPPIQTVPEVLDPLDFVGEETPIETAALRGILQKEGVLEASFFTTQCAGGMPDPSTTRSGDLGLSRQGFLGQTDQTFDTLSFRDFMIRNCGGDSAETDERITEFVYKIDHGVAPIVGRAFTLRRAGAEVLVLGDPGADPDDLLDLVIREADQGNCDLVAEFSTWRFAADNAEPYVYDVTTGEFVDASGGQLPLADLLDELDSIPANPLPGWTRFFNRLTFEALPLGTGYSKVRIDRPTFPGGTYVVPIQTGTFPNEAYADVPTFPLTTPGNPSDSLFNRTRMLLRAGTEDSGVAQDFFDAPRRLQFVAESGEFLPGTLVEIYVHHTSAIGTQSPDPCVLDGTCATRLELPIFATDKRLGGSIIWETVIEFEPEILQSLLLGGPFAPSVAEAWADPRLDLPPFEPETWNDYWWRAVYPQPGGGIVVSPFSKAPLFYPGVEANVASPPPAASIQQLGSERLGIR